ncbi:NnrU family protein [Noviherbaspirillum sp. UKPF54]|uniref:NnrU family protein n=1 Tax=Noviherbaspirillum sp. UKPF54 TaxID=2601898 RepID=UPI0011B0FAD4|nr:NnrU family protein [Noviherbaspirillum sp. UKPF54]QDZ29733.1 NnrU family protein [Noviherbaspirillum sp. UKPF54]
MTMLILGLVLFLGIHLLPVLAPVRNKLFDALGERKYKGLFSLVSAIGLALIVVGYARAPSEPQLFAPSAAALRIAPGAMIISFILLAAANMKTHIRRVLRHPMLLGVGIWAAVHLAANGETKATVLFGAFLAYALVDLASAIGRHAVKSFVPAARQDVIAVVAGTALALLVMAFHRALFGVAAVSWSM